MSVKDSDDPQWYIATCFRADHPEAYEQMRAATIEECLRVAQQWLIRAEQGSGEDLLDAIRALKDKP